MRITLVLLVALSCLACVHSFGRGGRRRNSSNSLTPKDSPGRGRPAIRSSRRAPVGSGSRLGGSALPSGGRGFGAEGQRQGGRGLGARGQSPGGGRPTGRGQRFGGRGRSSWGRRPARRGPTIGRRQPLGRGGPIRNPFMAALGMGAERRQWLRMVDANITIKESAKFNRTTEFIILSSFDRRLMNSNISSAFSAYDFQNGVAAALLRINNTKVCLVFPISDFNAAVNSISGRNVSQLVTTPDNDEEYIMKTDDKMTDAELVAFNSTSPALYQICQGRRTTPAIIIDATTTVQIGDDVADLDPVTFLSINGKVDIYLKSTLSL
ncbi:uncharacterized protein LOC124133465 [Haliotis rufescens]|uniref:uncharacterized protein LOC124133465 n=1 Tax=Haliotis rufescens TaxID=6454 RepID=UPI00201F967F|nr:uncharacterized protein LOC124133465 [Haliotis rufescens]